MTSLVFGWDISTSVIGCCCLTDDGRQVAISNIKLFDIEDGITAKYCKAEEGVVSFIKECREKASDCTEEFHFVEERLKNMIGKTNKNTLLSLSAINAVVSFVIIKECACDYTRIRHLYPVTVKKKVGLVVQKGEDKKEIVVEYARREYKDFPFELNRGGKNPVKGTDDMADAFIVAKAGVGILVDERKKVSAPKKSIRKSNTGEAL